MSKGLYFMLGAALGATAGATATYLYLKSKESPDLETKAKKTLENLDEKADLAGVKADPNPEKRVEHIEDTEESALAAYLKFCK